MQGVTYSVDIVLCIDTTGSMQKLIDKVKANALQFYEDLQQCMEEKGKVIDDLRIRVVAFRDYYDDADSAMRLSPFFRLPQDKEQFAAFVNSLQADKGGDEPENSLEALALAMQSEWARSGDKRRQIIIMWTDASAHSLEKNAGAKPGNYPRDLPHNFDELTDMWEGQSYMNGPAKRLIIYAPDAYAWTDIANYWENTLHYPSKAGAGLAEHDYQTIVNTVSESV